MGNAGFSLSTRGRSYQQIWGWLGNPAFVGASAVRVLKSASMTEFKVKCHNQNLKCVFWWEGVAKVRSQLAVPPAGFVCLSTVMCCAVR